MSLVIEQYEFDPSDDRTVGIDWTNYLAGETIASSEWSSDNGGTLYNEAQVGGICTVKFKDGVDREDYTLSNLITTSSGEVMELSLLVRVRE